MSENHPFLDGDGFQHDVPDEQPPLWLTVAVLVITVIAILCIAC